jgi:hypothetical protein
MSVSTSANDLLELLGHRTSLSGDPARHTPCLCRKTPLFVAQEPIGHPRHWSTPRRSGDCSGILRVVRSDPQRLARGFGKLVAVVLAAGLAGTGAGVALAQLTESGDSSAPALPAAASATTEGALAVTAPATATAAQAAAAPTTTTSPAPTATASRTQTAPAPSTPSPPSPRVQVLSALLDHAAGHVTVRVRVINRGTRPLAVEAPVLLCGTDEIPRDSDGGSAVRPLLKSLAAGLSATSVLRFTTSSAVAARLAATRHARLRVAKRSIALALAMVAPSG